MRRFNVTGVCVKNKHYMVNTTNKLLEIERLIEDELYFTINRSRQYGKTTTLYELYLRLKGKYIVIMTSFEGLGQIAFEDEENFCKAFVSLIIKSIKASKLDASLLDFWNEIAVDKLDQLSEAITEFCSDKSVILMIDEVDKSSNNQLFLNFLGILRNKYLDRAMNRDTTFKSVIFVGVYDVKNLKLKIRDEGEKKYNSPWNIATDFKVDMSFNPEEISTMLIDYENDMKTSMDIELISNEIYRFTKGYPFLVSRICKTIEEDLNRNWTIEGIEQAVKLLLIDKNTLFDDLFKNLENNKTLFDLMYDILIEGKQQAFNNDNPAIELGVVFGMLVNNNNMLAVPNSIFEIRIYNYLISKRGTSGFLGARYQENYILDGKLNMELILNKFHEFMYEEYRKEDERFLEKHGRLLFLSFIKPIINGKGFYFVETETRNSRRMDIVVTYNKEIYIIELKLWYGGKSHNEAYEQLGEYLGSKNINTGYLLTFDFSKNKKELKQWVQYNGKKIYSVII